MQQRHFTTDRLSHSSEQCTMHLRIRFSTNVYLYTKPINFKLDILLEGVLSLVGKDKNGFQNIGKLNVLYALCFHVKCTTKN